MHKPVGATALGDNRCHFVVWAPLLDAISLQLWETADVESPRSVPLTQGEHGYWEITTDNTPPGTLYNFCLNNDRVRPDPASRCQPEGVHGRSQVVNQHFDWQDQDWQNLPLETYLCYELHVGAFTPKGTFDAIIPRLQELKNLGITAIEVMPVGQFPGDRNWGYDGVYPYAVQTSYGGVEGLKRLVNACHQQGLAVILDVIYNHFGPEGNYTRDFGPYFTDKYHTPWGEALNFDEAHSDGVRNYFIENALYWFREFHMDALRLDAIHAIYDFGAKHILAELEENATALSQQQGRNYYLIAESDLNDVRVIRPQSQGGYGMDAQWSDDFHHCIHTLLTQETGGYYEDFGKVEQMALAWSQSFVYDWRYSRFRQRFHGSDGRDRPGYQFVVCSQNHDQVGNRMLGERLSSLTSFEGLKLAAATVLLAPAIPLLFMGEEYGEEAPFLYFISHTDPDLVQAVREGRKREFAAFHLGGDPPDAASRETLEKSTLRWDQRHEGHHGVLWNFYRQVMTLRRSLPPLTNFDRKDLEVQHDESDRWLRICRWRDEKTVLILMNWNQEKTTIPDLPAGHWNKCLDSADACWQGTGSIAPDLLEGQASVTMQPLSVVMYASSHLPVDS